VAYVIATLPKPVKADPIRAEVIGADYLFSMLPQLPHISEAWEERLAFYAKHRLLVLRPVLTNGKLYADHLERVSDWAGGRISRQLVADLRTALIPHGHIWMIELSVPELFSANRRKVGEVLIAAEVPTGDRRDFANFLIARLPGCFALYTGGSASHPSYSFIPSGAGGHVELYGCEEN
jgi:hypothetical protein